MTYQAHPLTDQEREDFIVAAGRRVVAEHACGDLEAARVWLDAQNAEISRRSPAQVARMEDCYFAEQGDAARRAAA